jgi:chromosome segregation ATPase
VQNAIEAQNTIDSDRALLEETQQELAELNSQLDELKPIFEIADQYNKLKSNIATKKITLERNELQLQILESDLQTRESELETVIERQESFRKNETAITHNQQIDTIN